MTKKKKTEHKTQLQKRNESLIKISDKIKESKRIAITSHLRPDGDSICACLALHYVCELLGKHVEIINYDKTPFPLSLLPDISLIKYGQISPDSFDLIILIECANVSRSGNDNLDSYYKINIDHHHSNDYYGDIDWVEPESPAVSAMMYDLIKFLDISVTSQIANHLYCGIVSDTGSFQFSNTDAKAFEVSYHLVEAGANPIEISNFLFNSNPAEKIMLLGVVLPTLQIHHNGKIAVLSLFQENLSTLNLQKEIDTEFITTLIRSIRDTRIVLFFKEIKKNIYRVSIRSKGNANSALVAEHFGGGGHLHAAGFTVEGDHHTLIKEIPHKVSVLLKILYKKMDGIIPVLKPAGKTSHDMVLHIRRWLGISKIGHFGTLDPMATGVLILGVGSATRLFPYYSKTDKEYSGTITLGYSTDTYDSEGTIISPETKIFPPQNQVFKVIKSFEGHILQTPPPYSAKKYQGKPLYALSRAKKEFPLTPSKVRVDSFKPIEYSPPSLHFEVTCGSGTYIRSLAHDLGSCLGCGAHLSQLERTRSGSFSLTDCKSPEILKTLIEKKEMDSLFIPIELLLPEFPKLIINDSGIELVRNGNIISSEHIIEKEYCRTNHFFNGQENIFRLFSSQNILSAFARPGKEVDSFHPFLVFNKKNI